VVSVLAFVVLLGVLITAHELGHFVVAKLSGVKVETFSIGFGPPIVSFTRGDTEYRIAWIPLGGYVRMLGMDPGGGAGEGMARPTGEVPPEDEGRGLLDKPPFIRMLIASAGPAMNLLLPFALLWPFILLADRFDEVPGNQVGAVDEGLPAWRAGMREGDTIVAIDGQPVDAFWQVTRHIDDYAPDQGSLTITVRRDGVAEPIALEVTPERVEQTNKLLGFSKDYFRIGYQHVYLAGDVAVADPQGPAARAGLQTFDRVVSVGDTPTPRYLDVQRALEAVPAGETAPVVVERDVRFAEELPFLARVDEHRLTYTGGGDPGVRHAGTCVSSIDPGSPAGEVLRRGDCILAVDGNRNSLPAFILARLSNKPAEPKAVTVLRDGAEVDVTLHQREVSFDDPLAGEIKQWQMGLALLARRSTVPMEMVPNQHRAAHAWHETVTRVVYELELTMRTLAGMFSGAVSPSQLSGPVTIFYLAGDRAKAGFDQFLHLMVLLSLSIALFNLLPVPLLDGGQMLVAFVEMVTRRPLPERVQVGLQWVGLLLIAALILFALGNDVVRMWRLSSMG
jgi:regulator of sigma E protease